MSLDKPIIVIGGGPAGSCVSTLLVRMGHEVILLERERFPRAHVGESLLPGSIPNSGQPRCDGRGASRRLRSQARRNNDLGR